MAERHPDVGRWSELMSQRPASVHEDEAPDRLEQRVALTAVTLALRTNDDPRNFASKLVGVARKNRMAIRRALARLHANNPRGLGPIGQRAAEALRLAVAMIDERGDGKVAGNRPSRPRSGR